MRILGFDTTTKYMTVCVTEGEDVRSYLHKEIGMTHSSSLIPSIDKVLNKADLKLKDMDAMALSIGPGSFTGLRIGVSTVKALSLATGIKVVGVPTLDVIALNFIGESEYIAPILDAKKKKVYSALYKSVKGDIKRISEYLLTDVDSLLKAVKVETLFFGDGVPLYGDYMKSKSKLLKFSTDEKWYPDARAVARLGLKKIKKGIKENIDKLSPMYLYPKECNVRGFKY